MSVQEFTLIPFAQDAAPEISITGSISRRDNQLQVAYRLEDPSSLVVLPTQVANPERRHGLWETTCLEFFLGEAGSKRYWEFNLSPTGHWNGYRFEDYRQGMAEEGAIATQASGGIAALALARSGDSQFVATAKLGALIGADQPLELGVTAVIEDRRGALSYWALVHTGAEADFHRRDSFVLSV